MVLLSIFDDIINLPTFTTYEEFCITSNYVEKNAGI